MKQQVDFIRKNWAIILFIGGLIGQWYILKDKMDAFSKHIEESNKLVNEINEFKGANTEFRHNLNERLRKIERQLERRGDK